MESLRRVVVTGAGTANPLGLSVEDTWQRALEGRSGTGPITLFDASSAPVRIAAEVKGFDPSAPLDRPLHVGMGRDPIAQAILPKDVRRFGRYSQLGLFAGVRAYADSGLEGVREDLAPERAGVNIGVGMGGLPEIQEVYQDFQKRGYRRITAFFILQVIPNIVSGQLSILLNFRGPNHCNVTACATSAHSIGESYRLIRHGYADVMLAGGAEAVVCEMGIGGFAAMRALSTRNECPAAASRPFDRDRDGFVMGEGATVLVLEEYERARRRGARIYGEILGYGATADAHHLTSPAPDAEGAARAMAEALREAGLRPGQIGYVNAHATSTPAGDVEEARAIAGVFGMEREERLLVSSTKSMTGHMLGAAGATEALFSLLSLRDQKAPPTCNIENLDPDCAHPALDFVAGRGREAALDYAASNSFGFGGANACLIFGRE
jgi:3-oxoacyl-[acyl-carrier-protein] synthase II